MVDALSIPRFFAAADACITAEQRRVEELSAIEQAQWQRIAFGTWRVEMTLAGLFGAKPESFPTYPDYLRQMGISDGSGSGDVAGDSSSAHGNRRRHRRSMGDRRTT